MWGSEPSWDPLVSVALSGPDHLQHHKRSVSHTGRPALSPDSCAPPPPTRTSTHAHVHVTTPSPMPAACVLRLGRASLQPFPAGFILSFPFFFKSL